MPRAVISSLSQIRKIVPPVNVSRRREQKQRAGIDDEAGDALQRGGDAEGLKRRQATA